MSTFTEIEAAVERLPRQEQAQLYRLLAKKLGDQPGDAARELPLVPATGRPITQQEIDDALDAD